MLAVLFAFATFNALQAQSDKYQRNIGVRSESIKVYGECDMDKRRIENAALSIDGVKSATWNANTQTLIVTYSIFNKEAADNVQKKIAFVGNDTQKYRADDAVYNALPDCCHYQRATSAGAVNKWPEVS